MKWWYKIKYLNLLKYKLFLNEVEIAFKNKVITELKRILSSEGINKETLETISKVLELTEKETKTEIENKKVIIQRIKLVKEL